MKQGQHLTAPDPTVAKQIADTVPGMAHFAGTGHAGKRCGQCHHWRRAKSVFGSVAGEFPCGKFLALMHRKTGPRVPAMTPACRYFEVRQRESWQCPRQ